MAADRTNATPSPLVRCRRALVGRGRGRDSRRGREPPRTRHRELRRRSVTDVREATSGAGSPCWCIASALGVVCKRASPSPAPEPPAHEGEEHNPRLAGRRSPCELYPGRSAARVSVPRVEAGVAAEPALAPSSDKRRPLSTSRSARSRRHAATRSSPRAQPFVQARGRGVQGGGGAERPHLSR
jgi:hypothetical protein